MNKKITDLDKLEKQKIIVVQATSNQLAEIKQLIPSLSLEGAIKQKSKDIYELFPKQKAIVASQLLKRMTLGDLQGKTAKTEQIIDFENSDEFYKRAKARKGFKIISDEFSDTRNIKLYEGFSLIEKKWRQIVIENNGLDAIKNAPDPENYQNKTYDHKISQYALSEFFENFLYQPATENYIRKKWNENDKTEDSVIKLIKLTMLDELGFPLKTDELSFLQQTRNRCMHFRVITVDEYSLSVDKINQYLKIEAQKEFIRTLYISLRPMIEAQKALAQGISDIVYQYQNFSKMITPLLGIFTYKNQK